MPVFGDPNLVRSAFMQATGLNVDEADGSHVTGWIDLGPEHHQPLGIVHGGVYASAIESAASIGAALATRERGLTAVGVNNNTNFLRSMSAGRVRVDARPLHQGATQQLWEVRITDERDRLVAMGQVRLQNITPRA